MSAVTKKSIGELDYYKGPQTIPGIKFRYAGKQIGVTAWGMNVLEIEAGCDQYPEHDHQKDGQEEVYAILKGSASLICGDEKLSVAEGDLVRIGPELKRKFIPGPDGVTILAIGAVPPKP